MAVWQVKSSPFDKRKNSGNIKFLVMRWVSEWLNSCYLNWIWEAIKISKNEMCVIADKKFKFPYSEHKYTRVKVQAS